MKFPRTNRVARLLGYALVALAALAATPVRAADGLAHCTTIRFYVPYAAGGGTDVSARLIAAKLGTDLKLPVIVENRPGAKSVIAYQALLRDPADGCSYLYDNSSHSLQSVYKGLPYDPAKDFKPVAMVAQAPNVFVVNPSVPAKTMQEFIAYAKANPGKVTYASFGIGSTSHLSGEVLNSTAGLTMVHVPYRGSAPAVADLMGGTVQAIFLDPLTAQPLMDSGKVRGLAVVGSQRTATAPNLPSMAELGIDDLSVPGWWGVFAKQGVSDAIVNDMADRLRRIASDPEVKQKMAQLGAQAYSDTPQQFAGTIAKDSARWQKVVRDRNLVLE
ncbi:tripartite tricarboxylate transporter substrate binding protein [Bordetella sp. LUAb4]|uniref:Bug family tripartite tricarboxylate transporter substrate binding protein n=1 Tax=Bordetella sp. LUAb4 TaxID=2843195 RepID=UPI001E30ABF6|nr:tripartite tricarboxylate transporter substrate binding protein [Bordetella sp. LUAb4]